MTVRELVDSLEASIDGGMIKADDQVVVMDDDGAVKVDCIGIPTRCMVAADMVDGCGYSLRFERVKDETE